MSVQMMSTIIFQDWIDDRKRRIVSRSSRVGLMPFAQISTCIGGALMVVLATLLLKWLH